MRSGNFFGWAAVHSRGRLPAFIRRERFEANEARLNANRQLPATPGAVRSGPAALAGLVRMADGGWRMADGGWRMADGGTGRPSVVRLHMRVS